MNKLQFLSALRSKLGILHANEINDIIDEYSGYIDTKIAEGKTEEEAVSDFGSMEDLAAEILDAYKINRDYTNEYSSKNNYEEKRESRSTNIDDFVNTLSDILSQAMDYLTTLFSNLFKDFSVESLAQLLVIFLVAIILIAIMKIPFFIVENIGSSFIHFIMPYRWARFLVMIWEIVVNIFYFLMALLVIAGLIQGVMDKKDISQSIRDMFRRPVSSMRWQYTRSRRVNGSQSNTREKSSSNNSYQTSHTNPASEADIILSAETNITPSDNVLNNTEFNDVIDNFDEAADGSIETDTNPGNKMNPEGMKFESTQIDNPTSGINDGITNHEGFDQNENEIPNPSLRTKSIDVQTSDGKKPKVKLEYEGSTSDTQAKRSLESQTYERRTWTQSMLEMIIGLLKVFILVVMLPIYATMLGIAVAIGAIIYLLIQGISIFGFVILLIGILALIGTCTNYVWYLLDRKKAYRVHSYKASIITACVLLGFGGVFSFFDVMRFEYEDSPAVFASFSENENLYYDLTKDIDLLQFGSRQIEFKEDNQLVDSRIKVQLQYHKRKTEVHEYLEGKTQHIFLSHSGNGFGEFKFFVDTMIEGLKDNTIYNLENYTAYVITIHGNKDTLAKLQLDYNRVIVNHGE